VIAAPEGESGQQQKVDGRRLRAERTRTAIVDGLLSLIEEGDLKPTAPRVAERANVSLRTVFQHFAEVEALFAAVSERQAERIGAMVEPIEPSLPLPERLDRFVRQRCGVLEFMSPVARAGLLQEPFSERVQAEGRRLREAGRAEIAYTFSPELDSLDADARALLLDCIHLAATWKSWDFLRRDQALSEEAAQRVVRTVLDAVLLQRGFDPAG
jgi:TetR/AcrR family transcriptional regulator, regulator of autoinduction and epiphytic fitness